jgi:hypothetical protein
MGELISTDCGYVKIHRKILEWGWYKDINTFRLFIHMLLKANWKDGQFKGTTVPRGSFVSSIDKLSEETVLTKREIRTAISHLKSTGEVTVKTTNKYSVFTVQNYNLYQTLDIQKDEQETDGRHSNDILTTTIKEKKEGKNIYNNIITKDDNIICSESEKSAPNLSGIQLILNDKTFYDVPIDKIVLWYETYPAVDIEQELQKMRAWLDSNPTRRKTRRGIERFINNWLSRSQDSAKPQAAKQSGGDTVYAAEKYDRSFAL